MKLMRIGAKGSERPALMDAQGRVRDLSGVLTDIGAATLSPSSLARLRALDLASLPIIDKPGRIGAPWTGCEKFLCIGLNYADHAAESNLPIPKEPILFMKPISCRQGPDDAVVLPQGSVKADWHLRGQPVAALNLAPWRNRLRSRAAPAIMASVLSSGLISKCVSVPTDRKSVV